MEGRWYGLVYRTVYRLGLTVWERDQPPSELVDLVEGASPLPPGRALDLGCGTGTDSVYLAARGWEVTGVDMVPRALEAAARRAARAGVTPRFVLGDVTRLADHGIGGGHTLVLDFGCFHTLPDDRRDAYVRAIGAAAAPGATLLLFGFRRAPRFPMRAGVSGAEVRDRFGRAGWEVVSADQALSGALAERGAGQLFDLRGFRLCRAGPPS